MIAKTVIRQFDTSNNTFGNQEGDAELLATLAEGIDLEEEITRASEDGEEDDLEGWVDEVELERRETGGIECEFDSDSTGHCQGEFLDNILIIRQLM